MRRIGIVTVGRSDFGIYRPLLAALASDHGFQVEMLVSGMHLSEEHGSTWRMVEEAGFPIAARVEMLAENDSPAGIAESMGRGLAGFAAVYANYRPDILVVLGDRFETFAAAAASVPFKIPLAHLHGGEATFGAMDEAFRHAITKMAHLHFAATQEYGDRIARMGEEPWRIHVTGALGVDNARLLPVVPREELEARFGLDLARPPLLVTYHPETMRYETVEEDTRSLMEALSESRQPVVFTAANADTNGRLVNAAIREFVSKHDSTRLVENFGAVNYFSMLRYSSAMVGNSSSGILEAPAFGLPVVNIGDRQAGRTRGGNVVDVGRSREEILAGIDRALDPAFRSAAQSAPNPYGDGHAAEKIAEALKSVELGDRLVVKRFWDGPQAA